MATWGEGLRALAKRSVALHSDPKLAEMRNFLTSHAHEDRLREKADLRKDLKEKASTQTEADHIMRVHMDADAEEDNDPNYMRSTDLVHQRLEWREQIDRKLKRLLQDTEMDLDGRLAKVDQHRMRCDHVDRTYDWYTKQGTKEARKERVAPSFLRYDPKGGYMPGSTRKSVGNPQKRLQPKQDNSLPPLSPDSNRSASLPCLLGKEVNRDHQKEEDKDAPPILELQEDPKEVVKFPDLAPAMARKASMAKKELLERNNSAHARMGFGSTMKRM